LIGAFCSKFFALVTNSTISAKNYLLGNLTIRKEGRENESTYWLIWGWFGDYFKYISLKRNSIFKLGGILNWDYGKN
jgi:hypothetical protein